MAERVRVFRFRWYRPLWLAMAGSIPVWFTVEAITSNSKHATGFVNRAGFIVIGVVFGIACALIARAHVETTDNGVVMVGPLRTRTVPWTEVQDARADYKGLWLETIDGRVLLSRTLGKSNSSRWFHYNTRADEAVGYINERAPQRTPAS